MNNSTVLITGALSGIGRATAIAFGRTGARVVVSGRRQEQGLALEAELRKLGTEAEFIRADASRRLCQLWRKALNLFSRKNQTPVKPHHYYEK